MPRVNAPVPSVGYLRRSTDKQEASIAEQRAAVERHAAEHGYAILRWYTDDAISGDDTAKRLDFQRMIADAKDKADFKAILCWDQDRFGRFDSLEAGHWIHPLRRAGVTLVTIPDGPIDWNDFTGRLMYSIRQEGKHQFLKDLSRNVTRGQLEAANNGSWIGSPPYAYRTEGPRKHKRLVIEDEAKAQVVRRIFREYAEGRPMMSIANRLNAEGIPSPSGRAKGWRWDSVKVILDNPAYVGDCVGGRWSHGKYHTIRHGSIAKSEGRCRRPEEEWIVHRDHHEAVIDRVTFGRAQAMLARGKGSRRSHAEEPPCLLSCVLRCGRCGHTLRGMKGGKGGRLRYYECGNAVRNGKAACQGTTVREDRILRVIADDLHREWLSLDGDGLALRAERRELEPGDLPRAFAKMRVLVKGPEQPAVDAKRIERQAKELAAKIAKAQANLVLLDAENIPAAQEAIRGMQAELRGLQAELSRRPSSERDVNDLATDVLRSLWWTCHLFRVAAQQLALQDEDVLTDICQETGGGVMILEEGAADELIRTHLRGIDRITVHTKVGGRGTRTRHVLEGGEIALSVGPDARDLNVTRDRAHSAGPVIPFRAAGR